MPYVLAQTKQKPESKFASGFAMVATVDTFKELQAIDRIASPDLYMSVVHETVHGRPYMCMAFRYAAAPLPICASFAKADRSAARIMEDTVWQSPDT